MRNLSILLPFFMLISVPVFTQKFGLKAGVSETKLLNKDFDVNYSDEFKSAVGFLVGATVEFPIKDWVAIESGVQMSLKGYKSEYFAKTRWSLYYLEIPVAAKGYYHFSNFGVYGVFGPYLGLGLTGKARTKYTDMQGQTTKHVEDVKWGSDSENDDLKRIDIGLTIGGGVSFNRIQIGLFYSPGLANISPDTDNGLQAKNRVFGIEARYHLGE